MATTPSFRTSRPRTLDEFVPSTHRLDLLPDDRPFPPRPSPDLASRLATSGGHVHPFQFISTAIFLLSNAIYDREDSDGGLELLCSLFDRDACLNTTLLRSRVPSVRAAWESLFGFTMERNRKDTFRVLTDIGIHNHWLNAFRAGDCLLYAVEMDCFSTVAKIVAYCCESSCSHWWRDSFEAILAACRKGNIECANLLIQHCDVNVERIRSPYDRSMFQELVAYLECGDDGHGLALELFLVNGANVDKSTSRRIVTERWGQLVGRDEIFDATRPTILDEVFYLNRSLFDKLRAYSRVPVSRITRTGVLVALEDGSQALRDYLSTRQLVTPSCDWRQVQSLLELLLAEQFRMPITVDLRIVRGLCEFGVDTMMPSIELDIRDFWRIEDFDTESIDSSRQQWRACHYDFAWHKVDDVNDRMGVLSMLLTQDGIIGEHVLEGAVAQYGTRGFECLSPQLIDFSTKAVRALVRAARSNNFEDVEFLFRKGVDPHSFLIAYGLPYSIQAVATQAFLFGTIYDLPDGGCSLEMIQFLARHGARLIVTPEDSTPFDFAVHLLREGDLAELSAKVRYVLDTLVTDKMTRVPSFLLESCIVRGYTHAGDEFREKRLEIFEYLFRQGAEVSPGSPLAALIYADGREDLVRDVLYSGSDLNEYWVYKNGSGFTALQIAALKGDETLVRLFLQEGANVNSPALGWLGWSALQGICIWPPATEEEHQRKIRICSLLIDQGADVNAAPGGGRITILGEAAMNADLELAMLLLREGADVNALSSDLTLPRRTALDVAGSSGCLDMVKFLLSANALSFSRGEFGYDGAITDAEINGHAAVADLIREHAAKVEAGTVFNPELSKLKEECCGYGLNTDDESALDDNEYYSDGYAEDVDEASRASAQTNTESSDSEATQVELNEQIVSKSGNLNGLDSEFVVSENQWPTEMEVEYWPTAMEIEYTKPAEAMTLDTAGDWTPQMA